jgi:xanthine dehydrogenase YagT iron-sulfur-binding subunit
MHGANERRAHQLVLEARRTRDQTIERLGHPGNLHPLQTAFVEHDAFQCGYCTPGQICSTQGLINEGHAHSRLEVREQMSGNICRCGAYTNIADAVLEVLGQEAAP